jgi:hypothetical protein
MWTYKALQTRRRGTVARDQKEGREFEGFARPFGPYSHSGLQTATGICSRPTLGPKEAPRA